MEGETCIAIEQLKIYGYNYWMGCNSNNNETVVQSRMLRTTETIGGLLFGAK